MGNRDLPLRESFDVQKHQDKWKLSKGTRSSEKHMMTRLQIALIACGSALMLSSFIGIYTQISSSGPHPYWTAWMVVLSFTVAGLAFASALRQWEKRH